MSIAIRDALIVTQDMQRSVIRGDVLIEDGRISAIGTIRDSADVEIDAEGGILMPGLVNTHTHVAMANMKGVADDLMFDDFLSTVFKYDSDREDRDLRAGTMLGCLEMIRSGTTSFVDLYYSEDVIASVVGEAGLRGVLCWCVLDQEMTTQVGDPYDNMRRFCESTDLPPNVIPGTGLQGIYVCSTETITRAREYAVENDRVLHMHLSETRKEVNDCRKANAVRPVEYLDGIGFWGPNCLMAHSAWLTVREVSMLGRSGASVSSCPVSNMKLATGGVAPVPEFIEHDVNVSLGTDGSTTNNSLDMFCEMKSLALLQKSSRWDAAMPTAQQVLDFATCGGARAIGLGDVTGSIEVGRSADLILLDAHAPNLLPVDERNAVSNIVYSANAGNVRTTICRGQVLMHDREVVVVDEREAVAKALADSEALLSRGL